MSLIPRARLLVACGVIGLVLAVSPVSTSAQEIPDDTTTTTVAVTSTTIPVTSTTTLPSVTTTTLPGATTTTLPGPTTTTVPGATTTTTTTEPNDAGPDVAPPGPSYDPNQLAEILAGYDEAVAEHAELLAQFELSVAQLDQLNASMVELSDRITAVEAELLDAETALTEAEGRVNTAQVRLTDVERRLADEKDLLEEQAVDAYIYGGDNAGFYALLNAESVDEIEKSRQYAEAVIEDTDRTIDEYAELQLEAERLRGEAADAAADAEDARDEVEGRRDVLEAERESRARAQADAFVAALAQQGLIEQVEAQRGDYEQRLRSLSGSSDSINTVLKEAQEGQSLPGATDGIFLPPVPDPLIASPYGPRLHPIFGTVRMHNGLDIDAAMGQPVRASGAGVVVIASVQGGYGNAVVIDHGNGLGTLYGHNSSFVVEVGDRVEMGDIIALAGSTGWSTGPHVHWEVRVFGNPSDPFPFMGGEELLRALTSVPSTTLPDD